MASLTKTLYQKPVQTAQKTAQVAARAAISQSSETLKTAQAQLGVRPPETRPRPENESAVPAVVQEIRDQGPANIDRDAIMQSERSRLAELEAELKALQAKRDQEKIQYQQTQDAQMRAVQTASATAEAFTPPQGKIKKAMGQVKKAVTSMISGRKQSETKAGSGKG